MHHQTANKRRSPLAICQLEARDVPAAGPNLLLNPSVETTASATRPVNWQTGKWGTNTATFSYLNNNAIDGARAVRVDMTSRSSGDAKWYHDDVPVTPGTTYEFSNQSISNTTTSLTLRFQLSNGSYLYQGNKVIPASATPQTNTFTFTAPANAVSVTTFHIIQSVGYLITDNFTLGQQLNSADVTAPTVSLTNPTNNAPVSGNVTVNANATDNVGVVGVTFRLNGNIIGAEDTTAPYSAVFNSTTLPNGTHILTATARDAAGNTTTSSPITITINNSVPDTTAPTVNIISPSNNTTVFGNVGLTANASDNVAVTSVRFYVDGNPIGSSLTTAPYTFVLDTTTLTNGTHTITAVAFDAATNSTTSSAITINVNNVIVDTTAPTVSINSPANNAAVSGTVALGATAADNIGVTFVRFYVDGNAVGSNITTAPYTFNLNTTTLSNGTHAITAVATDAAGNSTTSAPITVTVNNTVSNNLIPNGSFETAGANNDPAGWVRGSWGVNTPIFTYPVVGIDGVDAARVEITSYSSGDAKWSFNNVPVTAGQTYNFSDRYRSNTSSDIVIQYLMSNGTLQYIYLGTVGASPTTWSTASYSFVAPAGVASLSIFHLIESVGWLEVDNYVLSTNTVTPPPTGGALVSFTFDDGWNSQYNNALPILTAGNIPSTFYVMSEAPVQAQANELVRNPSLESIAGNGDPTNWNRRSTGTLSANFSVVAGKVGANAGKVEVTSYTNGDAAWAYQNVNVIPGRQYTLSNMYNSTASTTLAVQYLNINGTTTLVDLATLASTNSTWDVVTQTITVPSGVSSLTVVQLLRGVGSVAVDDFSLKLIPTSIDYSYFGATQVRALEMMGHEIGAHTKTHASLTSLSTAQAIEEINGSRTGILNMGVSRVDTLAYPYGDYNTSVKNLVASSGMIGARTVEDGFNTSTTDRYALKTVAVERATTVQEIRNAIDEAIATGTWVTLMFHRIDGDPNDFYGCTPETLQEIVNYVNSRPIDVVTVRDGLYRTGLA